MFYELECPKCQYKFTLQDDYESGYCPNCHQAYYYWDSVFDEDSGEEFFEGYYWE